MPVGQSRRAALAGQAQVERLVHLVGPPAVADQRAVGHLLEHARAAAGGVLLVARREVGRAHHAAGCRCCRRRHLPTPVQRCTASVTEPPSCDQPQRRAGARAAGPPAAGRRRTARGSTSTPGLSRSSGSNRCLTPREQRDRLRGVHPRQQLASGPGRRRARRTCEPPCAADQVRGGLDELRGSRAGPRRPRAGSRCARARSRRRSGRRARPSRPVLAQQRVEVAQVVAEPLRAAPRRPPSRAAPGRSQACGRPSPAPSSRIRHSAAASAASVTTARVERAGVGDQLRGARRASAGVVAGRPRRTASRRRAAGRARPPRRAGCARRRRSGRPGPRRRPAGAAAAPGTASAASGMSG